MPLPEHASKPASLFLTGAPEERELAQRLESGLAQAGHAVVNDAALGWGDRSFKRIQERIARSDFIVALLSERSSRSEHVLEVLRRARRHQEAQGRPRLLAVRVRYDRALPFELPDFLPEWRQWSSESDSEAILQAVLDVARGKEPGPGKPGTASSTATPRAPEAEADPYVEAPTDPLKVNDPFYVERELDSRVRRTAQGESKTLVIRAPQLFGKTSLLRRYLNACETAGKQVALVSLGILAQQELRDHPTFLGWLARAITRELGIPAPSALPRSQDELTRFIEEDVLTAVRDPVVIALDRVDLLLGHEHQTDFFSMLRTWGDNRSESRWDRLGLALVISTSPNLLIADSGRSPFLDPLRLEAFSEEECMSLNLRYPEPLPDERVKELWDLLGGHPYLTRLAYARRPSLEDTSWVSFDEGPFGEHLRNLRYKLAQHPERNLLDAMKQIIRGRSVEDGTYYRLEGAGLCRRDRGSGQAVPANRLYEVYFGDRS